MRAHLLIAAAALLTVGGTARADTYSFAFGTSASPFSGSGFLTTGVLEAPGEYTVATVIGTVRTAPNVSGIAVNSILPPGSFPTPANGNSFPANDNTIFVFNNVGTLSQDGISFILADGTQVSLYNNGSGDGELLKAVGTANLVEDVPVTVTAVAPTPEPSSFALLATGFLGCAFAVKRRFA